MVRITRMTRKRLGELLRDEGLITDDQIQEALASQRKTGELLGEVLVRLGYVTEFDIAKTIVTQFGLPYIAVKQYYISEDVMKFFSERLMRQYQFIPMDKIGNVITIAVGGLLNFDVVTELEKTSGAHIQVYVSTWSEIKTVIDEAFKGKKGGGGGAGSETAPGVEAVAAALPAASDADLAAMELVGSGVGAADADEEPAELPPAARKADSGGEAGDLTELGNMLLGEADVGGEGGQ